MRRVTVPREAVLAAIALLLFAAFAAAVEGFADPRNLLERSRYWAVPGMVAVGMTFVVATGGIDLSVGSIVGLSGIVLGLLHRDARWGIAAASIAAVGTGLAAGAVNGVLSGYAGIPPLVVTLATMALFGGAALGLCRARPVSGFPDAFQRLGQGTLLPDSGSDLGLPVPLFVLLVVGGIGWLALRRSRWGRLAECVGDNETAARFAAVDVRRLKLALYAASGLAAGLAAVLNTALYATARPEAGRGLELEAVACVVVGGTRIGGGRATVAGTLLGLVVIGMLRYGLEMAGVASQHGVVVVGILLVVTAVVNESLSRWSQRR